MRVSKNLYSKLNEWSNPDLANFMHFIYGNVNMDTSIIRQRIRLDENRKVLNECFIESNIDDLNTSFRDRYKMLKHFKFDVDIYLDYLRKLDEINDLADNIIVNKPYKSGVFMKNGYLNFSLQYSSYGIKSIIIALEVYKINKDIWNQ